MSNPSEPICELTSVADDAPFQAFQSTNPSGLVIVTEDYGDQKQVHTAHAGDLAKWIRQKNPDLRVEMQAGESRLLLHSEEYWLPLVFLANDVAFPVYLNLVASYIYDRMKGALKGETAWFRMSVEYEDKAAKTVKRFRFEGNIQDYQQAVKKFDVNKFMDE